MTGIFYYELNIFCILIVMTLFMRVINANDKQNSQRILVALMVSVMALCASDMLWVALEHTIPLNMIALNYIADIVYLLLTGFVSYLWFLYSEYLQESRLASEKHARLIGALPVTMFNLLVLTTPWTHWMFYIDAQGDFQRGPLYFLQQVVNFGYLLFTSIKAFVRSQNKSDFANKNKYLTIASFCIYPLICGVWQMYVSDSPILSMGITLAILQVYINLQSQKISIDPLTQLNNRNQMIRFLSTKMRTPNPSKSLYLLMMDMDYFKKINDQYGHVEGDKALVCVSNVLKKVGAKYNCFVSRYGGDEFIIVCEASSEDTIKELCLALNAELAAEHDRSGAPYKLHLSIGYAVCADYTQSIPDFIAEADKMLYKVKRARTPV